MELQRQISEHKIIFVIQARTGSTRLPGKVLLKVIDDFSMLDVIICRLLTKFHRNHLWVATTQKEEDRAILQIANKYDLKTVSGDTTDVLSSFEKVCVEVDPAWVVRVTGDNPLTCPDLCVSLIEQAISAPKDISYISDNKNHRQFPQGMVPEIIRAKTLMDLRKYIPNTQTYHLTHVTSSVPNERKASFKTPGIPAIAGTRLTVDEYADFEVIQSIFKSAKRDWRLINLHDVYQLKLSQPDLFSKNQCIQQKEIIDG